MDHRPRFADINNIFTEAKRVNHHTKIIIGGLYISFNIDFLYFQTGLPLVLGPAYRHIFPEVIAMIAAGRLDIKKVITQKITLNRIVEDGLELLISDKRQSKI